MRGMIAMFMYDLIEKKKEKKELTKQELYDLINGYVKEEIPDYQMSAFLMAVCFQGMTERELLDFTMAMAESGECLDLSKISGYKVDKHSTGGVGDKTTLILAPMVAALGIPMIKMSGRGLGYTGGTIDKLESIPGLKTALSEKEFLDQVERIKIAVTSQTKTLAPADKKLYALRDVTATVDSLPLIASSIMSKKLAAGADVLVLDVKTGSGAFMKTQKEAIHLAQEMTSIGIKAGRTTYAVITDMNQPLGYAVGNALEVKEAVGILRGEIGAKDLLEDCLILGSYLVYGAKRATSPKEAKKLLMETITSGKAYKKFEELVMTQGGDLHTIRDLDLLAPASIIQEVTSKEEGFVTSFSTGELGMVSLMLGGGRTKKEDSIDPAVGFWLKKKLGDPVKKGEPLAVFYANSKEKLERAKERFFQAVQISKEFKNPPKHWYGVITEKGYQEAETIEKDFVL